jgi:hypothetical protein
MEVALEVTVISLCDNVQSMFFEHVRPHFTENISHALFLSHLLQSTDSDTPACMQLASLLNESCIQSADVFRAVGGLYRSR